MFALYLRRHGNVPFGCPDAIIREESFPFWRAALNRFAGVCSDRPAVVPGQQKIGPESGLPIALEITFCRSHSPTGSARSIPTRAARTRTAAGQRRPTSILAPSLLTLSDEFSSFSAAVVVADSIRVDWRAAAPSPPPLQHHRPDSVGGGIAALNSRPLAQLLTSPSPGLLFRLSGLRSRSLYMFRSIWVCCFCVNRLSATDPTPLLQLP